MSDLRKQWDMLDIEEKKFVLRIYRDEADISPYYYPDGVTTLSVNPVKLGFIAYDGVCYTTTNKFDKMLGVEE